MHTDTYIHPTAIVGSNVKLGTGVKIGPHCIVVGNVTIGDGSKLYGSVSIGLPAQATETTQILGSVIIGKNCHIREFVTIHSSKTKSGCTIIGDGCYLMNYSHVSHDVILEDRVILINNVNLGGHVTVGEGAMLMANCAAHQFCSIGRYTSLTPFSATRQDLPPFSMFNGQPSTFVNLNVVGLRRNGFSKKNIEALRTLTKLFYRDKLLLDDIISASLQKPASKSGDWWGEDECVREYIAFIKDSGRGVSRRAVEQRQTNYT